MLTSVQLTTTATKIVQGTSTQNVATTCIQACNTAATTVKLYVYAVPNGNVPSNATLIYSGVDITSEDTFIVDTERMVLGDGDAIWASATTPGAINFTVSTVGI